MGLDCSHDAWSGAYSAFNRFRQAIAFATGGSFPPHYQRNEDGTLKADFAGNLIRDDTMDQEQIYLANGFTRETNPGLYEFLTHSDCDGEIAPDICAKLADEMEALLPKLDLLKEAGGHMPYGPAAAARRFIAGCREAAAANEPLEFF